MLGVEISLEILQDERKKLVEQIEYLMLLKPYSSYSTKEIKDYLANSASRKQKALELEKKIQSIEMAIHYLLVSKKNQIKLKKKDKQEALDFYSSDYM